MQAKRAVWKRKTSIARGRMHVCPLLRRGGRRKRARALTRAHSGGTLFFMKEDARITAELALPGGKTLYIVSDKARAAELAEEGLLAVYDDRRTPDPSFQIQRSYSVRGARARREILQALLAYDAANPTNPPWERTLGSLEREWAEHNFAYRLGFLRSRARDVDLDNHAEGKGALRYFLKSAWSVIFQK